MKSVVNAIILTACLGLGLIPVVLADSQPETTPRLRLEPGMHFAPIRRIDVDAAERFVVTASDDKTARVWDLRTGALLQVLRPPIGEGDEGSLRAVAISPDGEQVAVAGWTGYEWGNYQHSIYIFQRSNGQLQTRIRQLPNVIHHLAFSADGSKLAVALGEGGIRLFNTRDWQELARDSDYGGGSYSVDFDASGRVVSTSEDGSLRLYDAQLNLLHKQPTKGGKDPFFARFAPDGRQIAVGFADSTEMEIRAGQDLQFLRRQDTQGVDDTLSGVAWSQDGQRLYAGGSYDDGQGSPLVVWEQGGKGKRSLWRASQNTVMDIKPLKDGGVIVGASDPALLRLDARGQVVWKQTSGVLTLSPSYQALKEFAVNNDGAKVQFKFSKEESGKVKKAQMLWQLDELQFAELNPKGIEKPRHSAPGIKVTNWESEYHPKLNDTPIPLENYETSRSLAIAPDEQSFVLGTNWYIRHYEKDGTLHWQQPVPVAWAVNISGNNQWVVAALGDGTIRWYEKDSGTERLAFYLHPDEQRWVAWTPEGFYAAAEGAEELIGYHLNQGADQAAKFIRIEQIGNAFNRADLVSKALDDDYHQLAAAAQQQIGSIHDILQAGLPPSVEISGGAHQTLKQREFELNLTLNDQGGGFGRVEYRVNGEVVSSGTARPLAARAPAGQKGYKRAFTLANGENRIEVTPYSANNQVAGDTVTVTVKVDDPVQREPSLHVLSIGVSDYRDPAFKLNYAADDAIDFASTLKKQGRKLFKKVKTTELVDDEVTLEEIEQAFTDMAQQVQPQDVFVLYLAGHGVVVDGRYHYVPQDVIYENDQAIRAKALSEEKLKEWLALIEVGKRMMVIDSCHAGKALQTLAALDTPLPRGVEDKAAIARLMKATGSSVLAAASSKQQAMEGIVENGQGRGLFTHVLLKGLQGDADIIDKDGMIDVGELQSYARKRVPELSQEKWKYEQFPMFHLGGQDFPITQAR